MSRHPHTIKLRHLVPPTLALIISVVWLSNLRRSTATVKQENTEMQQRITSFNTSSRTSSFSQRNRSDAGNISARTSVRPRREKKPVVNEPKPPDDWVSTSKDWKRLVLFNNDQERYQYTEAWKRLKALAVEMSGDELTKAYQEMATLPIHAPFRNYLESVMLAELEKKNPEFAFSQYIERNRDGGVVLGGYGNFDQWLARDPEAAARWYENQLAAGTFDKSLDGNSPARVPFESAYIMALVGADPASAEQIMKNFPPELRGRFGDYVDVVPMEKRKSLVDLLRKTMLTEDYMALLRQTSVFEYNFRSDYDSDPENAKISLDRYAVTPEERSALLADQFSDFAAYRAMRASGGGDPRRNEFDANRKWVQAVDPSSADRATGAALQTYLKKVNNPESYDFVEKTALDYVNSGAGDQLLVPIIEGSANGSNTFPKDRARGLAAKITNSSLRNELLEKLN
ncbi:MAG: hypothetical protein ACOVRB_01655 [Akkermansiaceae bacterium]